MQNIKFNYLKKKIRSRKLSLGGWLQSGSTDIAEILSSFLKIDWICIDVEHGHPNCKNNVSDLIKSIEIGGAIPFVRPSSMDEFEIRSYLDCGAKGIIIPNVNSAIEIKELFSKINFYPFGNRGVGYYRANKYGLAFDDYLKSSKDIIKIVMIENVNALENLNDILKIKEIDSIFIGPYDLSSSLGIPGEFDNKIFTDALKEIKSKSKFYKKTFGIHLIKPSKKDLKKFIKENYSFIACSIDIEMIINSMKNIIDD
tara:strand:+ start:1669 stop:2436 length:768 start_codon:yes stop_codon:yes gene_type:complete